MSNGTGFVYQGLEAGGKVDGSKFSILNEGGTGLQIISISPGMLLTPHSHPNSNETTYCLAGQGEVGIVIPASTGKKPLLAEFQKYDFNQGDVVFLPQGSVHYFLNTSKSENLEILLTFDNPNFDILTLAETLHVLPKDISGAAEESSVSDNPMKPIYKQEIIPPKLVEIVSPPPNSTNG